MVSVPEENSERMEVVPANEDKKDKSEKKKDLPSVGAENNEKTLWMVSFFFSFLFVFSFVYSLLLSFFLSFFLSSYSIWHDPSFSIVSQFSYLLFLKTPNTVQNSCPLKMPVEKFSVQLPLSENIPKVKKFVSFMFLWCVI
jgi:hypothetical protein